MCIYVHQERRAAQKVRKEESCLPTHGKMIYFSSLCGTLFLNPLLLNHLSLNSRSAVRYASSQNQDLVVSSG